MSSRSWEVGEKEELGGRGKVGGELPRKIYKNSCFEIIQGTKYGQPVYI